MAMFLTVLDFERASRLAGITDFARDPASDQYTNPHTLAAYKVWESVAQSEHVRSRPPAWLTRFKGRDQGITPTAPGAAYTPEQWSERMAKGWGMPLALYPTVPAVSLSAMAVLLEHQRQRVAKGYSAELDQRYVGGELAAAAWCYIRLAYGEPQCSIMVDWPWPGAPIQQEAPLRALEKAGALLIAEHERQRTLQANEKSE